MLLDIKHALILRVSQHVEPRIHIPKSTTSLDVFSTIGRRKLELPASMLQNRARMHMAGKLCQKLRGHHDTTFP